MIPYCVFYLFFIREVHCAEVNEWSTYDYEVTAVIIGASSLSILLALIICVWKDCWSKSYRSKHKIFENEVVIDDPSNLGQSEFTIFSPLENESFKYSNQTIEFETLPEIRPRRNSYFSYLKPAGLYNTVAKSGLPKDWFEEPYCNFPRDQLQFIKSLGKGWFGQVIQGEAHGIIPGQKKSSVTVKVLQQGASCIDQMCFLYEVKFYKDLFHPNILKLLGCCLQTEPYLIILEHCSMGDLKGFLLSDLQRSKELLQSGSIFQILCDVGKALHYMHEHNFIHNDLAARNCLLSEDISVKIGDYGCGVGCYPNEYYYAVDAAIPLRWCSPLSLHCTSNTIETKEITKRDNIWTFGVFMWELLTLTKLPYCELNDEEVIQKVIIDNQITLPPPQSLDQTLELTYSVALYNIMLCCWNMKLVKLDMEQIKTALTKISAQAISPEVSDDLEERWNNILNDCPDILSGSFAPSSLNFETDFCGLNYSSTATNNINKPSSFNQNSFVSSHDSDTGHTVTTDSSQLLTINGPCKENSSPTLKFDQSLNFQLGHFESESYFKPFVIPNSFNSGLPNDKESSNVSNNTDSSETDGAEHISLKIESNDVLLKVQEKSKSVQDMLKICSLASFENSDNDSLVIECNKDSIDVHVAPNLSGNAVKETSSKDLFNKNEVTDRIYTCTSTLSDKNVKGSSSDCLHEYSESLSCTSISHPGLSSIENGTFHEHIGTNHTGLSSENFMNPQCTSGKLDDSTLLHESVLDNSLLYFRSFSELVADHPREVIDCSIHTKTIPTDVIYPSRKECSLESEQYTNSLEIDKSDSENNYCSNKTFGNTSFHDTELEVIFGPSDDHGLDFYQSVMSHVPISDKLPHHNEDESTLEKSGNSMVEQNEKENFESYQPRVSSKSTNENSSLLENKNYSTINHINEYGVIGADNEEKKTTHHNALISSTSDSLSTSRLEVNESLLAIQQIECSTVTLEKDECDDLKRESDLRNIKQQLELILPDFSSQLPDLSNPIQFEFQDADNDVPGSDFNPVILYPLKHDECFPKLLSPIIEMSEESSCSSYVSSSSYQSESSASRNSNDEFYPEILTTDILQQFPQLTMSLDELQNPKVKHLYYETVDYSVDDYLLVNTQTNEAMLVSCDDSVESKYISCDDCNYDVIKSNGDISFDQSNLPNMNTENTDILDITANQIGVLENGQSPHTTNLDSSTCHMEYLVGNEIKDENNVPDEDNEAILLPISESETKGLNLSPIFNDDSTVLLPRENIMYTPDWENESEFESDDQDAENNNEISSSSCQTLSSSEEHIYFVDSSMVGTEENHKSEWDDSLIPCKSSIKKVTELAGRKSVSFNSHIKFMVFDSIQNENMDKTESDTELQNPESYNDCTAKLPMQEVPEDLYTNEHDEYPILSPAKLSSFETYQNEIFPENDLLEDDDFQLILPKTSLSQVYNSSQFSPGYISNDNHLESPKYHGDGTEHLK